MNKKETEETKLEKIQKEAKKIKRIFKDLDENKKKLVDPLIEKAAFMSVTLDELQETINNEIYLNMSKNYAAIVKQLTELVPAAKRKNSKLAELKKKK